MVLYTGDKSKLSASKSRTDRLRLSLSALVGVLMLSSGQAWAECSRDPGTLSVTAGDVCVDNDVSRLSTSGTVVKVDGGSYTGTNVTIGTTSDNVFGVDLQNNGNVVLEDTTITTSHPHSYGISANSGSIKAKKPHN